MLLFYLITLLYGSNSLYTEMTNVLSANLTVTKEGKKHGILDVLKSDPQMFISEVQNLDPASIKHIISLLEELRDESETRENEFVTALTDAQTALDQSNQDLIDAVDVLNTAKGERDTAQGVVDDANVVLNEKKTAVDSALAAHGATEDNHESKTTERNDAQTALDDEKPSLDDEQQILTDVINLMTGLHDKHRGLIIADTQLTWNDAFNYCASKGGTIVMPVDKDEIDSIRAMIPASGNVRAWLGIQKDFAKNQWVRDDGKAFDGSYTHWKSHEGNQNESNAGMVWQSGWDGHWYDMNPGSRVHYTICRA